MLAGEDAKAIETLARFKTPSDFLKSHQELRTKLSERASPPKLSPDATPEQVAEYRKGLGVPEVPADAKPDAYLAAFKIEPPKNYEMTNVERGMLGDFAKLAYEKGYSPDAVKGATEFFFAQQQASTQALNKIAVDFQKSEQNALRDELGSREYEAQKAAANAWLSEQFKDQPDGLEQLLHARMPNGGKLGDSQWLFKVAAQAAMGAGMTDRIEGNAMEASGRSLAEQQAEIEGWQFKDRARYNDAMQPGGKYEKILAARLARGEIDESGEPRRRRA